MGSPSSMYDSSSFFIDGEWVAPHGRRKLPVIHPATEERIGEVVLGTAADVDVAVAAARAAFEEFSQSPREARAALLGRILETFQAHLPRLARAISDEMGAPMKLALGPQTHSGLGHFAAARALLGQFAFEEQRGTSRIRREPIGVCGLITPWNWPINQICCKVAPALAAGCTIVLKPSELAPLSAHVLTEILEEAGVPRGVFNLVQGDGAGVGEAIARHPGIDLVSFTGSTRAGVRVAEAAAGSVKRVSQELGGKSANIILDDADLESAVRMGVMAMMVNTGQSCNAPSRMLVPARHYEEAIRVAKAAAREVIVGAPDADTTTMGPLGNEPQFDRVQRFLATGLEQGAILVSGSAGRARGAARGYFVEPAIFTNVDNRMTIAREEIFGPVLCMISYDTEGHAVEIANDSPYGLSGYVHSRDLESARRVAGKLRTGMVHINGAAVDLNAPFGGYKQSGNGREWGQEGLTEFLETKAILGYGA